MPRKVTTSLQHWDFQTQHVQQNLVGGDFVGSHSCILCATAPRLSDMTDSGEMPTEFSNDNGADDLGQTFAIPIGVIDTATLQQDRQMAQIFEIGSKRSYILAGRTVGQMQIARVFYKGPNLLRMLYAYYPAQAEKLFGKTGDTSNALRDLPSDPGTQHSDSPITLSRELMSDLPSIKDNPGYNNIFMNLNSDLFSQPYGMILYIRDNNANDVAAVFLEECYVQNHALSISANQIVMAENCTLRFERVVPIKVKVVEKKSSAATTGDAGRSGAAGISGGISGGVSGGVGIG